MTSFESLDTPAALIDVVRMQANIDRMQQRMRQLGVRFRPHVKTSKSTMVVQQQIRAGAQGVTVSTIKEAEMFFAAGVTDILYAVGVVPSKLDRLLALIRRGCDLKIITDNVSAAHAVAHFGQAQGHEFNVWIEVDTDGHRSGIDPHGPLLIEVAQALTQPGARLGGVMTHAGSSYDYDTEQALVQVAQQECTLTVHAAQRLRAAGFACPEVSIGSTPTALSFISLDGVTEVRAGVYVFFDLVMHNIGVCTKNQIALSVLTTVIGHQPEKGWAIVDAGWMALSRDRGTQKQQHDYGYGQVCDVNGRALDEYIVSSANQEHGIISRVGAADQEIVSRFPVGTLLRILPNHACATGAQFPAYEAVHADGSIQTWSRFYGWS